MEKVYENANRVVPTTTKLTSMLNKWQKVINPDLGRGDNKYMEIFNFKKAVLAGFPGKVEKLNNKDVVLAFLIIFAKPIKQAIDKGLFHRLDYAISTQK